MHNTYRCDVTYDNVIMPFFHNNNNNNNRYNETQEEACGGYESSELNFALHVRMGDRRDMEGATPAYFSLLEDFMEVVTEGVVGRGHAAPTFHVFSEALYPCPSQENGTFHEFPLWPVERDQVGRWEGTE